MQPACKSPGISILAIARYLGVTDKHVRNVCRKMRLTAPRLTRNEAREVLFAIRARQGAAIARNQHSST